MKCPNMSSKSPVCTFSLSVRPCVRCSRQTLSQTKRDTLAKTSEVGSLYLSDTRNWGTPLCLNMSITKIWANSSAPMSFQQGLKCTVLLNLSTNIAMAVWPALISGKICNEVHTHPLPLNEAQAMVATSQQTSH